jgi:hypothetical protein
MNQQNRNLIASKVKWLGIRNAHTLDFVTGLSGQGIGVVN